MVGKPPIVDHSTEKKTGLNFEVGTDASLPDNIMFRNEKGNLTEKKVSMNGSLHYLSIFEKYDHSANVCRKKKAEKPAVERKDQQQKERQIPKGSIRANANSSLPGRARVNGEQTRIRSIHQVGIQY